MITFENTEVYGFEAAIRGMRNPMNSWDKSDSGWCYGDEFCDECGEPEYVIGPNDLKLMKNLAKAGTDHRKYLRMIAVSVDITAPLYWWKEFDTYKVGTAANSCSTMHKIHAKKFTLDDFSHEHLTEGACEILCDMVHELNYNREQFLNTKDKRWWWNIIQLLPSSYNQKRTVMLNYEVLANIYKSRQNHKLDEWSIYFIDWVKSLPYSDIFTWED